MFTVESKSYLAKLMAVENITVEHRYAKTASFNLKTRTLTCPTWKNMDGNLYDLLLGHEISHALHTPTQGWHKAVADHDKKAKAFQGFLNVIEDARIERLIKNKYPGLRRSMIMGYKDLLARDFFGTSRFVNLGFNKMYLIDRLNLAAKCGSSLGIHFTPEEQKFYDEMMCVETWNQVVSLANRLFEYSKDEQKEKDRENKQMMEMMQESLVGDEEDEGGEEGEGEYEESDEYDEDSDYSGDLDDENEEGEDESEELESGDGDGDEDSEDEDEGDEDSDSEEDSDGERSKDGDEDGEDGEEEEKADDTATESKVGKGDKKKDSKRSSSKSSSAHENDKVEDGEFLPKSMTDEAFRSKEESLAELVAQEVIYTNIPIPNLKEIVVPAKHTNQLLTEALMSSDTNRREAIGLFSKFIKKNSDYIGLLVKEFEMRKAATTHSRTKVSDTGDINLNKIYNYRLEDNIFQQVMKTKKGKSHGLILLLDRSGSMTSHIKGAMEQIIVLASFCRKVNIPFSAYNFTDFVNTGRPRQNTQFSRRHKDISMRKIWLQEMFNSTMSANEFNSATATHLLLANIYTTEYRDLKYNTNTNALYMGNTPLCETLIALRDITRQFKNQNQLDIINTIIVHDGDADPINDMIDERGEVTSIRNGKLFITDSNEKISIEVAHTDYRRQLRNSLMRWYQMTTGSRIFGFYIVNGGHTHSISHVIKQYYHDKNGLKCPDTYTIEGKLKIKELSDSMKENRFIESYTPGYTRFYFIPGGEDLEADNTMMESTTRSWTPSRLLSAYKKSSKRRTVSRVLIGRFVQMIATTETN